MRSNKFRTVAFSLMAAALLSCGHDEIVDRGVKPVTPVENGKKEPAKPVLKKLMLRASVSSFQMKGDLTRADAGSSLPQNVVRSFADGMKVGIFMADTVVNWPYSYDGIKWEGRSIYLREDDAETAAFFMHPYDGSVKDARDVPVSISSGKDYLFGKTSVSPASPVLSVTMKHILSFVRFRFELGDYSGEGRLSDFRLGGIPVNGVYNIREDRLTLSSPGEYSFGSSCVIARGASQSVETFVFPQESMEGVTFTFKVDGKDRSVSLTEGHHWEPSNGYVYTLSVNDGFDVPVSLDITPVEGELLKWWNDWGKNDDISDIRKVDGNGNYRNKVENITESFSVQPGLTNYGCTLYRGEGNIIELWPSGNLVYRNEKDPEKRYPKKSTLEYKYVLFEPGTDRVVEQFQTYRDEVGGNVMNSKRRVYLSRNIPVGMYEMGVLMRRAGASYWVRAGLNDGVTHEDMMCRVVDRGSVPGIRNVEMIGMVPNDGYTIFPVDYGKPFALTLILSNQSRQHLKGKVIAVYGRTFEYPDRNGTSGDFYRKCLKSRQKTKNDEEFKDVVGTMDIDMAASVTGWKGLMKCKFPVMRKKAMEYNAAMGKYVGYCTAKIHFYWQPEGSDRMIFMGADLHDVMEVKTKDLIKDGALDTKANNFIFIDQMN